MWTLLLVCSTPVRSGAPVCPWHLQGMMSPWQPHCSDVRSRFVTALVSSCPHPHRLDQELFWIQAAPIWNFSSWRAIWLPWSARQFWWSGNLFFCFYDSTDTSCVDISRWDRQFGVNCTPEARKIDGMRRAIINHKVAYTNMSGSMASSSALDDK